MKRAILIVLITFFISDLSAEKKLVIAHTNDTHSQIEPTSKNASKFPDQGGMARREALLKELRKANPSLLLFDDGDFCQGTPYFNAFKGKVEIEMMNRLKYDAGTLGNHEFDNGIESLARALRRAKYPIICANYDVSETSLKKLIKPYVIFHRADLKIGVIGIGVEPKGLIPAKKYEGIVYLNPIETANKYAQLLKTEEHCDVVIVLSHLGISYEAWENKIGDMELAAKSRNIDVILGGHSHTFLKDALQIANLDGKPVVINHAGKMGLEVDQLELVWNE
ncbi:MAG: metallophosphoesterase [Bacteroidales bacterium]|nr:metallophosphoesterase [Bacteroidales bacterium]